MNKRITLFKPIIYVLIGICVILALLSSLGRAEVFYASGAIALCGIIYVLFQLRYADRDINLFLNSMGHAIKAMQTEDMVDFPLPIFVVNGDGEVLWFNERGTMLLGENKDFYGHMIQEIIGETDFHQPCPEHGHNILWQGHMYSLYVNSSNEAGETLYALYFVDDNELKYYTDLYFKTKPAVMIVTIDNYDELAQSAKESERSQVLSEVEYQIEQYVEKFHGIIDKVEKDRFVVMVEEQNMQGMIQSRFDILDRIREIASGDRVPTTLSIGVGRNAKDLRTAEQMARQALDMALGRGGDQAAVRTENGYDFFGGLSKGVEKRTKVKTRIVATALSELIESSDLVLIMGHSFADLDCFGSAVGLLKAVKQMGKRAFIAINKRKNLVGPLYDRLESNGYAGLFIEPAEALGMVTPKTLLIIVDTHIEHILESAELYRRCETVVVIDHHRKMVGHIDNAVIFYHEPYASSASEMVSELVQYLGDSVKLGRLEAEALLSGIMLDTKNFVIKTGVRTFEAAAYLRRLGADTVEVRKLFSSSMDSYQRRSRLVSSAEVYRRCAIASTNTPTDDIKIVAPQAADELLNISDVDASFVMYEYAGGVSFSARSMGALNVQIIMEKLGGGGHLTMAGAQIPDISLENARQKLLEAIDQYLEEQKQA